MSSVITTSFPVSLPPSPHGVTTFNYKSSHEFTASNSAGTRLPRIPRRISNTPRSNYDAKKENESDKDGDRQMEERVQRARADSREKKSKHEVIEAAGTESDSDCATPTPATIAAFRAEKQREDEGTSSIAPRVQRGRGRKSTVFDLNSGPCSPEETHASAVADEQESSVVFPTSSLPDSPPASPVATSSIKRSNANSLRLNLDALQATSLLDVTNSHPKPTPKSASMSSTMSVPNTAPLIRKKSGEVLKSSLKQRSSSSSARVRPSLSSLMIGHPVASPSISAPTTPTHSKFVHFDSQLEHVKLFLAEQKPLAVSRDGSPTADSTGESGTEGEFVFPPSDDESVRKSLRMKVLNMREDARDADADVRLETLTLAEDARSANGIVRVKNIAFEKWVAIRFTFDWWQTTSEVTAKWVEACEGSYSTSHIPPSPTSKFDRFSFNIRLSDLLMRIEEKTLFLAVRYTSAGREMWDNNRGENYKIIFEKKSPQPVAPSLGVNELKKELERMIEEHNQSKTQASQASRLSSAVNTPSSKKAETLASRYDFAASLKNKNAWRPQFDNAHSWEGGSHTRMNTFPSPSVHSSVAWPQKHHSSPQFSPATSLNSTSRQSSAQGHSPFTGGAGFSTGARRPPPGSPRDPDSHSYVAFPKDPDAEDTPFPVPSRRTHGGRHHQRSYFDAWAMTHGIASSNGYARLKRTPPGTPVTGHSPHRFLSDPEMPSPASSRAATPIAENLPDASPSRCHSFPPLGSPSSPALDGRPGVIIAGPVVHSQVWPQPPQISIPQSASSEESTPSETSMSSPSMSPSPMSPPDFSMLSPSMLSPMIQSSAGMLRSPELSPTNASSYNFFLNKFCFYTGRDALLEVPPEHMRRTHSASSVEEFLSSTSNTPSPSKENMIPFVRGPDDASSGHTTPTRSSSLDDIAGAAGMRTPTPTMVPKPESPVATPVLG